jgi:hypothetical protein
VTDHDDTEALIDVIESGWQDEPTDAEHELADTVARRGSGAALAHAEHQHYCEPILAALAPAIEPALDRPLTVDAALAEVERRIRTVAGPCAGAAGIVAAYREEMRRG